MREGGCGMTAFPQPWRPCNPLDRHDVNVTRHLLATAQRSRIPAPQQVFIRRVMDQDRARFGALVERCRGHGGLGGAASARGLLGMIAGSGTRQGCAWLVARDATVLGAIGLVGVAVPSGVRWSIPFLLVAPETRRTGLGYGLVQVALGEAEARGATEVTAETLATWPAAAAFWRSVATRMAG